MSMRGGVNISASGNMYGIQRQNAWILFDEHLSGDRSGLALVISSRPLSGKAADALQKTFAALDYGNAACTFAVSKPNNCETELDSSAMRALIEGIDPVALVITDTEAAKVTAEGYREKLPLQGSGRLFGRSVCVFMDFEDLLSTESTRQQAWSYLKKLPHKTGRAR